MNAKPPILEGEPASDEDNRLLALFDEMEKKQIEFLDEAGKRIIEMVTAVLGLMFAVVAFGKDFPPAYVKNDDWVKALISLALASFILALLAGFITVQPRKYRRYEYDLTRLKAELEKIAAYKAWWFRAGSILFFLGAISLAILIGRILLSI